jgi:hypothetical protein
MLNGEKSEDTAATTATLPPPIKSSRRVMLDKEELDTGVSVEDTDETTGDVTSGSGDGFISGNNFKFGGRGQAFTVKVFSEL